MQIIVYVLAGFALIGAICTVLAVFCGTDLSELLPVYNPRKKKVGATFWGSYDGDFTEDETLQLPKISEQPSTYVVGSGRYEKGLPVRNARR
jgi:hypothetical protein